jgi:hypothetical protein
MWIGPACVTVEPRLHELPSSEGCKILSGKFEPFAVLAAILKTPVPVFLDSGGVIGLDRVDDLRSLGYRKCTHPVSRAVCKRPGAELGIRTIEGPHERRMK